jgi:phospholipid/cholesterol/gamma-HCH transport system substrate-binding protein
MLSKVTRIKLVVFGVITGVALFVTALYYVHLPQQVGIGRYDVNVELANAGGLYPQAMVTYRGVEVGKVTSVDLGDNGTVVARLQVDNGTKLPKDSIAQVRSASVIGEQYVNFLPPDDGTSDAFLADGATVPVNRTMLPTTTNTLLASVDGLLQSIPTTALRTTVDELGTAFDGVGADLGRFIDSSSTFQRAATANLPATLKLIDDATPVLRTQEGLDPEIRSFAKSLDSFSGQLSASDDDLRGILATGAPFMDEVASFTGPLTDVLPGMLTELANTGHVLRVYLPGIEHLLAVVPALLPQLRSAVPEDRLDDANPAANLWFKLGVDPPPCTQGFDDADKMRNPADLSPAPAPKNSYCKVPTNDPRDVRGAHNQPCPNGGRGATAAECGLVFDKSVTPGQRSERGTSSDATLRALLGPDDSVFLFDPGAPSPQTWQALLKGLVSS